MKMLFAVFAVLCTMMATGALGALAYEDITAEEMLAVLQSDAPIVVVDVRRSEEYAQGHLAGALLLPNENISDAPLLSLPVKDAAIYLYCRTGVRSAQAAQKLVNLGYTNVHNMLGGITAWQGEVEVGDYVPLVKQGTLSSFKTWDVNGVVVDEQIFAPYKLTMVNIWATFCGPCIREMPELALLKEKYAAQGLNIVGIVADVFMGQDKAFAPKGLDAARDIITSTGATNYPHLLPSPDLLRAKISTVTTVPETIFVDAQGNQVGQAYLSARNMATWEIIVQQLLAEVDAQ